MTEKPPKSEQRQRNAPVFLRMLPEERDELRRRAKAAKLSVADLIRRDCLDGATIAAPEERRALIGIQAELNKLGSNVNQVARIANRTGAASADELQRMNDLLEGAHRLIERELQRPGAAKMRASRGKRAPRG